MLGLFEHEGLRVRRHLLERARQHYIDERWDCCALMLITIMDGFVNDIDPSSRRGLHTREPEEMSAWDSLAGHHMGLRAVMPVFRKSFKRRRDEEAFELYRHGIVHGTVVNYNNQIVATKAWNMLYAVADWAAAHKKSAEPKQDLGIRDALKLYWQHVKKSQQRENFKASSYSVSDDESATLEIVKRASDFLETWKKGRWGLIADYLPSWVTSLDSTPGERATTAKRIYGEEKPLQFSITKVSFPQLDVAIVCGHMVISEESRQFEIRWFQETLDGKLGGQSEDSRWVLALIPPRTFFKER